MMLVVVALEDELPVDLPPEFTKLVTGVGKVNASYTLTNALAKSVGITKVINYGTAGGNEFTKGKLYGIDYFVQRDMDCGALGCSKYVTYGEYEAHAYTYNSENETRLVCGTGDSFSTPTNDYTLVDMEGYALAKVCHNFHVPFYSYKFVTDGGDPDEWESNKQKGVEEFLKILKKF